MYLAAKRGFEISLTTVCFAHSAKTDKEQKASELLVVINFSAGEQRGVSVPSLGNDYEVVFSTEDRAYGGAEDLVGKTYANKYDSVRVDLLPLSGIILKPVNNENKNN